MNYFIVNQKKTFKEECEGSFIWAPKKNKKNQHFSHWDNMLKIEEGDVIFSNNNGIVSVNVAKGKCYDAKNPFHLDDWDEEGRKVDLEYHVLLRPIKYMEYLDTLLNLQGNSGAFCSKGANLGYLFTLTKSQYDFLMNIVNDQMNTNFIDKEDDEDLFSFLEEEKQNQDIQEGRIKSYSEEELKTIDENWNYGENEEQNKTVKRVKTDPRLKATCLENAGYQCEISNQHVTFSNSEGAHQYVECHHLIPMKAQKDFVDIKLDSIFNLICLCPLCHAQIHYGNSKAKSEVFWKIYNMHEKDFNEKGFNKTKMQEIFDKYYF